jgi:hypothetical protein
MPEIHRKENVSEGRAQDLVNSTAGVKGQERFRCPSLGAFFHQFG